MKPETYYPIGPKLMQLTQYQINKLNSTEDPLKPGQISDLRMALEKEAAQLGEIQKKNLGDLTAILREGLPVICGTSARILEILTPAQRAATGNALVVERREGFQNTINMSLTNLFMHPLRRGRQDSGADGVPRPPRRPECVWPDLPEHSAPGVFGTGSASGYA